MPKGVTTLTPAARAKAQSPAVKKKRAATIAKKRAEKAIKSEIFEELAKQLTDDKNGKSTPYYQKFMEALLKDALAKPSSSSGMLVASTFLSKDSLDVLDKAHNDMMNKDTDFLKYRLLKNAFTEQRDVILDTHTCRKQAVMCSRRAGKTDMVSTLIDYVSLNPNSPIFYIGLTFTTALAQIYDLVLDRADASGIKILKSSKTDGTIEFDNGSILHIKGNANMAEIEKLRGFKARLVVIDEAQSQRNLKYLLDDVIGPLLVDYSDSTLVLTGTPPRLPKTFFEKAYLGSEFKSYHWTMKDNPFIENADQVIEDICVAKGLTLESPLIQREYLGVIAYDTEAQVFKDFKTFEAKPTVLDNGDTFWELPSDFVPDRCYVGVDFGFSDYNAVVGLAINVAKQQAYVFYIAKFNRASVSDIVTSVKQGYEQAKALLIKNPAAQIGSIQILCDTNEQTLSYEMAMTYKLPCYNAYKYDKSMAIEQLAEEARTGRLLIPKDSLLEEELEMTLYKRGDDDTILPEIDDDLYHPDAVFGLLYASRSMFVDYGRTDFHNKHGSTI